MNLLKTVFTVFFAAAFGITNAWGANNCNNPEYRKNHKTECSYTTNNSNTALMLVGGAALAGFGAAMMANNTSHSSHTSYDPHSNTNIITNLRVSSVSYLNSLTNGDDIDQSVISSIKSSESYQRNHRQFDKINSAWSTARGFTGKNSTINIFDDFAGTHGNTVREITNYIAPDANINTYNIASAPESLFSYNNIANTMNNAATGQIYNASWQIPSTNAQNAATAIYNNNSPKTYTEAQDYFYNTTSQNFINQIRNTAIDNDAIFVWAAGNESANESGTLSAMPLAFPDLDGHFVNVVAIGNNGQIAWYSNQCGITQNYCIAAPGSAWNTDTTDYASGTSFAAPVVSGAIAVIKEAFPYMNATQITALLFTTATDLGQEGVDSVYGWGLLDLEKATKPVGTPKIVLSNDNIQPLNTTNVSGTAAGAIKNANIKLAFVDDFGRAFTTNLSDNIRVIPYGRGFDRLRESETDSVTLPNGIEFGFKQNNLLKSSGLVSMKSNDITNFIGYKNEFNLSDDIKLYQQIRLGISNPAPEENSIVSGFSNIYTRTVKAGINWNDLSLEFAIPDQITYGNMSLYVPVARANNGHIVYNDANINLATKPSMEYTVKYNNLTATYINNPDWKDEVFIMTKFKKTF